MEPIQTVMMSRKISCFVLYGLLTMLLVACVSRAHKEESKNRSESPSFSDNEKEAHCFNLSSKDSDSSRRSSCTNSCRDESYFIDPRSSTCESLKNIHCSKNATTETFSSSRECLARLLKLCDEFSLSFSFQDGEIISNETPACEESELSLQRSSRRPNRTRVGQEQTTRPPSIQNDQISDTRGGIPSLVAVERSPEADAVETQPGSRQQFHLSIDPMNNFIFSGLRGKTVEFNIKAGPGAEVRGGELFSQMMNHYKSEVKSIGGKWNQSKDGEESTNFEGFEKALTSGSSLEIAALNTWTGRQARKYGFTEAKDIYLTRDPNTNKLTNVYVVFSRPAKERS